MIIACLVASIALQALKRVDGIPGVYLVAGAMLLGVAVTAAYLRLASFRFYLTVLSPAVLIFPGLFLFYSPVSKVVFPKPQVEVTYPKVNATAPIVMVIFDELPVTSLMDERRQIDQIRYPNFAALAQDATWFRNATTVADFTTQALPAILTGKYPEGNRHPTAADHPRSIFTLLTGSYHLKVSEARTQLCPEALCEDKKESALQRMQSLASDLSIVYLHLLLPKELSVTLPSVTQNWGDFAAGARRRKHEDKVQQFVDFIRTIDSGSQPTLYLIHSLLPHAPFYYLPSGKTYSSNGGMTGVLSSGKWSRDELAIAQSYQRHLLQVAFTDALLGRLLARLKEVELYDPSLIVVTADHGISFRQGNYPRKISRTNLQDILQVPLIIKAPYQQVGEMNDLHVESIDILPTVADILGMNLPWPVDGRSVQDTSISNRREKVVFPKYPKNGKIRQTFPVSNLETQSDTLRRKVSLFGTGTNPRKRFYQSGPCSELVDQRVVDLEIGGESGVKSGLYRPSLFADVDPESDFVPADIMGYVRSGLEVQAWPNLAIAVNGTVRATTRPWTFPQGKKAGAWSAIVDETSFHAGQNEIEIFVISRCGDRPVLKRSYTMQKPRSYLNMALGHQWVRGVQESGFQAQGWWAKSKRRWTKGAARLVVPIDENRPPQALKVDLASTGPKGTEFTVLVNSGVLFHESLPPGGWSKTFSLAGSSFNQHLTIELLSDTFVPAETTQGSADRRTLGVRVNAITLLDSDPVDSLPADGTPGN